MIFSSVPSSLGVGKVRGEKWSLAEGGHERPGTLCGFTRTPRQARKLCRPLAMVQAGGSSSDWERAQQTLASVLGPFLSFLRPREVKRLGPQGAS